MSDNTHDWNVNFDVNPIGPMPRDLQPADNPKAISSSLPRPVDQASGLNEFDEGFLTQTGILTQANARDGTNTDQRDVSFDGSADPTQSFGLDDPGDSEETRDVINRLFSRDLDRADEGQIQMQLDPTLEDDLSPDSPDASAMADSGAQTKGAEDDEGSRKRKGSSRANMLTRGGACEFCKRRKLKCSAEAPSCSACSRTGRECVYSQKRQKSRVKTLEDRLWELEKRLDPSQPASVDSNGSGPSGITVPAANETIFDSGIEGMANGSGLADMASANQWLAGLDLSFLTMPPDQSGQFGRVEPDLMTLADAAASDGDLAVATGSWPWDGMSEDKLAGEIARAVEGGKGVGEKIVGHL